MSSDIKERKGTMVGGDAIVSDPTPGIHSSTETGVTNDPFRQQVENNANQRQTEEPKKNEAEGELYVQGQTYRDKGELSPEHPPGHLPQGEKQDEAA